jgi:hypothetical protein
MNYMLNNDLSAVTCMVMVAIGCSQSRKMDTLRTPGLRLDAVFEGSRRA